MFVKNTKPSKIKIFWKNFTDENMFYYTWEIKLSNKFDKSWQIFHFNKFIIHFNSFCIKTHIFTDKICLKNIFFLQKFENDILSHTIPVKAIASVFNKMKLVVNEVKILNMLALPKRAWQIFFNCINLYSEFNCVNILKSVKDIQMFPIQAIQTSLLLYSFGKSFIGEDEPSFVVLTF